MCTAQGRRRNFRKTKSPDFSFIFEFSKCLRNVFNLNRPVSSVNVVKLYMINLKASQGSLKCLAQCCFGIVILTPFTPNDHSSLGCNGKFITTVFLVFSNQLFRGTCSIYFCRVKEVYAVISCCIKTGKTFLLIRWTVKPCKVHATE